MPSLVGSEMCIRDRYITIYSCMVSVGALTLKNIYVAVYAHITYVRGHFAAATASTLFFFADGACFLPCSAQFLVIYFSGLRPPFFVGASPCQIPRHINNHTYLAASSRDHPGFVRRCLLPRPPAPRGFTLCIFRRPPPPVFLWGYHVEIFIYITVYILRSI